MPLPPHRRRHGGYPAAIFPGIPGYALAEPAFHATVLDDAANDSFQLAPDTNFQLLVTAADPGIGIYTASGMLPLNTAVGLGQPVFDYHPIWHIPAGPIGATYNITIQVRDTTGTYTDSAPLTIPFTAGPEPGTLALIALALLLGRRQRR
jgi:MYXO-CTERM domain-containing protein